MEDTMSQSSPIKLPCGCRLDGRYICPEHERTSVARFVAVETLRLVAVGLFVAMLAVWAAVLGTG
jgi:hypothetical protein